MITLTVEDLCGGNDTAEPGDIDECGVCFGDNSTCTGCTDISSLNYSSSYSVPCSDGYVIYQAQCTENELVGENCCCTYEDQSVPVNTFTEEISTILSGNPELLDIYNKLLEGNDSCIDMLNNINLPQASYSKEAICGVLIGMAGGQYGQCVYGQDTTCDVFCTSVCGGSIPLTQQCGDLNQCICQCIDDTGNEV